MEALLEFEVTLISDLQSLGEWLVSPMTWITFLGTSYFYLFVAPVVYWCWDAAAGMRVAIFFLATSALNSILKLAFHLPRPYWVDSRVGAYSSEVTFGMPSGHSQNAVVVWGGLAAWIAKKWAWVTAIVLIFLIGISRVFLGVHFVADMLVGWMVGAVLLCALLRWEKRILAWFKHHPFFEQILIILAFSLIMILAGASIRLILQTLADWSVPADWVLLARKAKPDEELINPLSLDDLLSAAGVFFGFTFGGLLIQKAGGFDAGGVWWKRVLRFALGILGVFLIYYFLGQAFPDGETLEAFGLRYLRYALIGLWIAYLAPMLFVRLNLAAPAQIT